MNILTMAAKYSQHYRAEWELLSEFKEWIQPVEGDSTKAYCKYCRCNIVAKIYCLKQHLSSSKHIKASEPMKGQTKIEFPVKKKNLCTQKAECSLALFICEHASILTTDHLSEMCKKTFSGSQSADLRLHRTKCTNIIKNVLAPHFYQELVADIKDQEYSLLIDESTDISVSKLLGVTVRYFSESLKKIISTFLGLVELEDGTAASIVNALKSLLAGLNLNIKKLIGIGTDNASVMTGTTNGVHQLLKNETGNENLILVRCVCHSLQLALSHASAETIPRPIEFLIRETYNWFSHSSNRKLYYKDLYKAINCGSEPLKIPQLCNTRWISIEPAICRILEQWIELKLLFQVSRSSENCYMAELLYGLYNDPANHLFLIYIKPIVQEVQAVNKLFESNDVEITKLYNDLITLTKSISGRILNPTARVNVLLKQDLSSYVDPSLYMGYAFENQLREYNVTHEVAQNIKQRCVKFTLKLVNELQARLPTNFAVLQKMSMFSVSETLRVIKPSIVEIAQEFKINETVTDKLISQWRNIVHIKWECTSSTVEFWCEVLNYKDAAGNNPFAELAAFATKLLSLPHSNADIERVFSQVNLVKTKLRNSLSTSTLNAILYVRFGLKRVNKCCHTYDVPDVILRKIGTNETYSSSSSAPNLAGTSSQEDTDEGLNILFVSQND